MITIKIRLIIGLSMNHDSADTSSSWVTTFESENLKNDSGSSVSIGPNGEIYVGGYTQGIENEFGQVQPGRDAEVFIASLDEYGNIIWTEVLGTTGADWLLSDIECDQNGNINLAYSNGEDKSYQIMRFSPDGDLLLNQNNFSLGGENNPGVVGGVSFDDDGIAYVTGGTRESDYPRDLFYQIGIVKSTDTEQDIVGWNVPSGSPGKFDIGKRSFVSENNSIYIIGLTESDLNGEINPGYRDNFISKYNSEGDLIWTKMMVEPTSRAYMICDGQNDHIYVAGFTNQDDLFVILYDEDGNQIWKEYYPLTSTQETTRIASHPSDGIYYVESNEVYRIDNNGVRDLYLTLPEGEFIKSLSTGEDGSLVLVGAISGSGDTFVRSFNASDYIVLDNLSFDENLALGTTVTSLSGTDEYGGFDHTYTLVDGDGAIDNHNFYIAGNEIKINSTPDFEDKSSYEIRIQVEDQNGLLFEQSITLTVNDLEEMPSIQSIEDVFIQEDVTTFMMEELVVFKGQEVDTVIVGTENRDRITGTSDGEVLAGMEGKDILTGGNGADGFLFNQPGGFGNRYVDKIRDFNPQEGDSILLDNDVFSLGEEITIEVVSNRTEARKASRKDVDFVYHENTGLLYFNENGRERGWGDGGQFAILQGSPELGAGDFTIV